MKLSHCSATLICVLSFCNIRLFFYSTDISTEEKPYFRSQDYKFKRNVYFPSGMNDDASTRFKEREAEICSAMADTMKALYACYVDDFNCDTEGLTVKTYIIVDSSVNYDNGVVRASMLKQELSGYVGK